MAAIATRDLTKRYGRATALDGLTLEVNEGEVFGYLGPNGAGKSTTISLLLGLVRPTAGSAQIFGLDVRHARREVHERIAYVPSEANLWPSLTAEETLQFLANVHGRVDAAYRADLVERFDLDLAKKVRAHSHGNKQKILLVAALASRADLLLFDEPTTGLDPLMEQVFRDCVREARERGQTVLLSSHILSEVDAVCDRVAMLQSGRIIEIGRLDALRDLASAHVVARLDREVPDLSAVAGVRNVRVDGQTVECDVSGSMDVLMTSLATAGILHLTTREPSLEELFMARYNGGQPAPAERP